MHSERTICPIIVAMPADYRHRAYARPIACIIGRSRRDGSAAPRRASAPARGTATRGGSSGRGRLFHAPSFSIGLVLGAAIVLITGYLPELLAPPVDAPPQATNGPRTATQSDSQKLRFEFDDILSRTRAPIAVESLAPQAAQPQTDVPMPSLPPGTVVGGAGLVAPGVAHGTTVTLPATPPIAAIARPPTAVPVIESTPTGPLESEVEADLPPITTPERVEATADKGPYMLQAASFRTRNDADRLRAELLLLDLPASTGEVNVGNSVWYRVTVGPFPDQAATNFARERLRERNLTAIPFRR